MVTCALDCVCYLSSYNFKIVQQMSTGVIIENFIKIQIYCDITLWSALVNNRHLVYTRTYQMYGYVENQ